MSCDCGLHLSGDSKPLNPVDMRLLDEYENGLLNRKHDSPGTVLYEPSKSPTVNGASISANFLYLIRCSAVLTVDNEWEPKSIISYPCCR